MHKFIKKFKKLLSIGAILILCLSFALPIHAERHEYDTNLSFACQFGSFADLDVAIKKGARFAMPDWHFAKAIAEGNRAKILELKDEDRVYWNVDVVNTQIQTMCEHDSPVITDKYLNFLLATDILYKDHRYVYTYALDHNFNKTIKSFETLTPDINKYFRPNDLQLEQVLRENDLAKIEKYISKGLNTKSLLYDLAKADTFRWQTPHDPEKILQMANFLLEHGADPNYTTTIENGMTFTALGTAAENSNARLVHFLLEHGADPNIKSSPHHTRNDGTDQPKKPRDLCYFNKSRLEAKQRERRYIIDLFHELEDGSPLKPYNQEEVDNSPTADTWGEICGDLCLACCAACCTIL